MELLLPCQIESYGSEARLEVSPTADGLRVAALEANDEKHIPILYCYALCKKA
jgi:hypothetical protein